MYIPEFWCGVIVGVFATIAMIVAFGIWIGGKRKE